MKVLFKRWIRLGWKDQIQAFKILIYLVTTKVLLKVLPLPKLFTLYQVDSKSKLKGVTQEELEFINITYARLEKIAFYTPIYFSCLVKSLAFKRLILKLYGIKSTLHIGVQKEKVKLEAHAWLGIGDRTFGFSEGVHDGYVEMDLSIFSLHKNETTDL